jgi:hypothetical protein
MFILSPPYSGSTLTWRILSTSPEVSSFKKEGQHLRKTRSYMTKKSYLPETQMPWDKISKVWHRKWNLRKSILLEKSPPHLVRAQEIAKIFSPAYFIALIRNPYAFCEGHSRRVPQSNKNAKNFGADFWVRLARFQKNNIETLEKILFFKYEDLVDDPLKIKEKILNFVPELQDIDVNNTYGSDTIDGYGENQITDYNQRKLDNLTQEQIEIISKVLSENMDIMDFYKYQILK